ncbi:MAG: Sensor protein resE [Candidatus Saccharibacteria bacterium]|nr:Sensor protein resE [Candidatus Saccharibacteria bacterium]
MLIVIISTVISLLIGLFVLTRNPGQLLNRVYAVTTFAFVVLILANSFTISGESHPALTLLFIRIVVASTSVALLGLYLLSTLVRENKSDILDRTKYQLAIAFTVIVVALELSPAVFADISFEDGKAMPLPGLGIPVFAIHSLFFLIASLLILFRGLPKANRIKRPQFISIIIGLVPILVFAPVTSFVMPVVLHQTEFIMLTPLYAAFFVAVVAYAMVRHGLFDIKKAAIRTFTYILTLITLSAIYYALAYLVSNVILRNQTQVILTDNPINIVLALVLAFIFQPIKRVFDRFTNFVFYRNEYNSEEFFASLNRTLVSTTDLQRLLERISNEISATIKSEQAFFALQTIDGRHITAGTEQHSRLPAEDLRELKAYFLDRPKIIQATFIEDRSVKRLLTSHKIEIVMALSQGGSIVGFLCLGEHRISAYSRRDLRVLETISDELVIAIQNALSVQEVKDVNAHLEQRIDSATKELRASNTQLQKLDEAKDEFISMASHQLRTPLTSIKGYISMLSEGDVGKVTDEQKHLLDEAFMSSERMVRLIGDFLNVSRLQTGKFIVEKHPADLAKIVEQEIDSLATNAASRNLKFTYKKPKKFPELNLDESKIRQVIMNFSDNAIYYSKDNSTIKINLKADKQMVEFTVKDTGIGVPEEEKEQLFNKFFRATNARKQRPDGTGVGLFLAKKVIDAHDGDIIFESKEGKGSTFGFRLPLAALRVTSDSK